MMNKSPSRLASLVEQAHEIVEALNSRCYEEAHRQCLVLIQLLYEQEKSAKDRLTDNLESDLKRMTGKPTTKETKQ